MDARVFSWPPFWHIFQKRSAKLREEWTPTAKYAMVRFSSRAARGGIAANRSACHAGYSAKQLFSQGICYTYDDVIFHPGHIHFGAHEVG